MRYLAVSRGVADHWYPTDLRKRGKVDMYLDQHHSFLRQGVGVYAFKKYLAPSITGHSDQTYADDELDFHKAILERSLAMLESALS